MYIQTSTGADASAMPTNEKNDFDMLAMVRSLWRGKYWVLLVVLLTTLIGGTYAYVLATRVYTSDATVVLESRQEQVVDIESVVTGLSGDQATINTEVEVIRSRRLAEKLLDRLNLIEDPEFNFSLRPQPRFSVRRELAKLRTEYLGPRVGSAEPSERRELDATIDNVLKAISVTNIRQSYVFRITVTTESAQKSADMANALSQLYILEQLETKFEATEKATNWLTERVAELQVQLEAAEAEVKEFNTSADLVSAEGLAGLNVQIKDLRDRARETQTLETTAQARLTELRAISDSGDLDAIDAAIADPTLSRIIRFIKQSNQANPDLTAVNARMEQIISRAQLELTRASSQRAAIESSIVEQEEQVQVQSADLVKLQQLEREADASRLIYEFFLNRLKETSVQQGVQQADSRILSQAVVPTSPSAPRKSLIMGMSVLMGLLLGCGIVILRELSQNTFRDTTELEARTGYTVIGQIPSIPARRRKNVLKYLHDKPTSAAAEAIRNLRTSVLLSNLDNPPRVIMSTSSLPREGKTTQSFALTQNLVGLGKSVLLIEGDIRRRVFSEYFDLPKDKGLLSVLSGDVALKDAAVRVEELGADILVGEKTKTNAADIFSSERFRTFVDNVRNEYDYIVIDTPPVLAVPDARIIGKSVDAILYAVKWDSTKHRQVRDGLRAFEDVNVRVTGLVMSQVNAKGMKRYGYGYSYGSYSDYYDN